MNILKRLHFSPFFTKQNLPNLCFWLIAIIAPFFVFYFIFTRPTMLTTIASGLVQRRDIWLFVYFLFISLSFFVKGLKGSYMGLILQVFTFLIMLLGLWSTAHNATWLMLGIFSKSDGLGYANDALGLLNGNLYDYSGKRPLFTGFLAVILVLTGQHLKYTLLIITVITAIAFFFFAHYLSIHIKPVAIGVLFAMILLYTRRYIGLTFSELPGIALSALAICFYLISLKPHQKKYSLLGLFTIFLAFLVRPSTVFLIPFLLLWSCLEFNKRIRINWKYLLIGCLILIILLGLHQALYMILAEQDSVPFGNFSYVLYGLAKGGVGWRQVYFDFPEVKTMLNADVYPFILEKAFASIKEYPSLLLKGILISYRDFFVPGENGVYGYTGFYWFLIIFAMIGSFFLLKNFNKPFNRFLIFALAGILLSVPIAPPIDSGRMRVYAIAIPFTLLLPSFGISSLMDLLLRWKPKIAKYFSPHQPGGYSLHPAFLIAFTAILAFCMLFAPLLVKAASKPPEMGANPCNPQEFHEVTRINDGWYVNIKGDETKTFIPNVQYKDFIASIHALSTLKLTLLIEDSLPQGSSLIETYNILDDQTYFLITPTDAMPDVGNQYHVCGQIEKISYDGIKLVKVREFHPLESGD